MNTPPTGRSCSPIHENRFSKIEADLLVLKWMVGFVLALLAGIALKLFLH